VRLDDGELVWRFTAARSDLRTVSYNQVESLWPVHGSVLVLNDVAYCDSGRSTWLDGGIDMYALDPATGRVVGRSRYASRYPKINEGKSQAKQGHVKKVAQNLSDYKTHLQPDRSDSFSMAGGTVSDVLVSDGTNVFMHQVRYDAKLNRRPEMTRHLFSTSSLLDGNENHRSHWVVGSGDFSMVAVAYSWIANGARFKPGLASPYGLMLVFDDATIWGVRRQGNKGAYSVVAYKNRPYSPTEKPFQDFRNPSAGNDYPQRWKKGFGARPRAMIKSGDRLYLGCMSWSGGQDPWAASEGRAPGTLQVVSPADGSKIAEYKLESPPVWDGMAAANERLFISTVEGGLECWGR